MKHKYRQTKVTCKCGAEIIVEIDSVMEVVCGFCGRKLKWVEKGENGELKSPKNLPK